ncbi:MAG: DUF4398 domain-containing protein [Natronospirillum sp.]|uniref:DUF4398 domain-containing protein n=1 Tax=Natronospirillum sp. TaxID=2812955 RepID=UPI0025E99B4E|nr:DUF4398 domain-containing protein [Natronospirillum sp.]MCH8550840.1 DUF4398 domain-containing protein [Natronospirillum sp.]
MNHYLAAVVHRPFSLFCSLALVALLAACASTPSAPTESLTAARDAIASAEQAGARQHAGAELEEAQQQLARAEEAVIAEAMVEADWLAQQARITAELAMARTESARATEVNRDMRRAAEALETEMQRQGDQQ